MPCSFCDNAEHNNINCNHINTLFTRLEVFQHIKDAYFTVCQYGDELTTDMQKFQFNRQVNIKLRRLHVQDLIIAIAYLKRTYHNNIPTVLTDNQLCINILSYYTPLLYNLTFPIPRHLLNTTNPISVFEDVFETFTPPIDPPQPIETSVYSVVILNMGENPVIEEEEECPVCYEEINKENYLKLGCNHILCVDCFTHIRHHPINHNCPLCRSSIKKVSVLSNYSFEKCF
jgi:hypothetical protein